MAILALTSAALFAVACGEAPEMDGISQDEALSGQCSFSVTKNTYDGPNWWGTIIVKNTSSAPASGVSVSFDVPSGVSCDYAPTGWSKSQTGKTCAYAKASGSIAAGASFTLEYSATSQTMTSATNVKVAAESCGSSSSGGTTPAPVSGQWRKANLTNFTSYPDPGSEECALYNGCTWAGQFAALSGKQPESWVKANNIVAVHSKDFAKYKLKTLRLRQGTKQIDVKVYDMCADSDCSGCCTANSKQTGFLIDIEKYTMERFGSGSGVVEWMCLDCQ